MICTTTRKGIECTFMRNNGCSYTDKTCHPAVEACEGCESTIIANDMYYCKSYPNPASKWRYGSCNFATHIIGEVKENLKLNPIKASKRIAGKK